MWRAVRARLGLPLSALLETSGSQLANALGGRRLELTLAALLETSGSRLANAPGGRRLELPFAALLETAQAQGQGTKGYHGKRGHNGPRAAAGLKSNGETHATCEHRFKHCPHLPFA